jgi:hypothetical protein
MSDYALGDIVDYHHKAKIGDPLLEYKGVILWLDERYDAIEIAPLTADGKVINKVHSTSFQRIMGPDALTQLAALDRDLVSEWIAARNRYR